MTAEQSAVHGRSRWRRVLGAGTVAAALALAGLAVFAFCAAGGATGRTTEDAPGGRCRTLAHVIGPEDLVEDREHRRLLVSAVDRRGRPAKDGAIWQIPLHPAGARGSARRMILSGRDGCSFRPQGIDLLTPQSGGAPSLLYVINHHDSKDSRPESRCFDSDDRRHLPSPHAREGATSIEVFRVDHDRLRFLRRLAAPSVLSHGNDLVALPDGDLWVTMPPKKPLALLAELLGWGFESRLVHFECDGGALGCGGTWRSLEPAEIEGERPTFPNGIAWRPSGESAGGELFVASTLGGGVFAYELRGGRLHPDRRVAPSVAGPDNLSWVDEERKVLLTAAHPNARRFLRHQADAAVASPSEAWALSVDGCETARLFRDDGRRISAASAGLCVDGELVLGQVFGNTVEACRIEPTLGCGTAGRESEAER